MVPLAIFLALIPLPCAARGIPSEVTVRVFIKPEGSTLTVLARTPLAVMHDIDFPERRTGELDPARLAVPLEEAATRWIAANLRLYEESTPLGKPRTAAVRVSPPADRSFDSYARAAALLAGPGLPVRSKLYENQALLDVQLEYPILREDAHFSADPAFARFGLHVTTFLQFLPPGGEERAYVFTQDPGRVPLDPRWYQAGLRFFGLGLLPILQGTDCLLFLFCLMLPFRDRDSLSWLAASFTAAFSITLIAFFRLLPGGSWFAAFVDLCVAASIAYVAIENVLGKGGIRRRCLVAFGCGLLHGSGFGLALNQSLQFAGAYTGVSLLAFDFGLMVGELLVLAQLVTLLALVFRLIRAERACTVVLSVPAAYTGWHWMFERGGRLRQYPFPWPQLSPATTSILLQAGLLLVALTALSWFGVMLWHSRVRIAAGEVAEPESAPEAKRFIS